MGQEIMKASDKSRRPPSSKSGEHLAALPQIPGREGRSAGAGPRRDASTSPGRAPVALPSLLLPLCDQLSYRCTRPCQRAATSRRQRKRTPWALYANVPVRALPRSDRGSLIACISEHPAVEIRTHTCRETRKRFSF